MASEIAFQKKIKGSGQKERACQKYYFKRASWCGKSQWEGEV